MNWRRHYFVLMMFAVLLSLIFHLPLRAMASENSISITLNHSEKDVDEGMGFLLTATVPSGNAGIITWTTSSSSVATVDSSGYVYGKQAGSAVITASYTDIDGTIVSANCTVYVTVPDGLYYIKNTSSDLCLYNSGSAVSIQSQDTSAEGRIGQLWKITYVANGKYEIHPLRDTSVALTVDYSDYVSVGETEAVSCWGILHNAFGYAIQYFGNSSESAKPIVADMPGSKIYLGNWETNLACHWKLEKAYGIFLRSTKTEEIVDSSTELILGKGRTCSLANLGIAYEYYGSMTGGIAWSTDSLNIVTVDTSGCVSGANSGVAKITVSVPLNGVSYSYSCYISVASTVLVLSNSPEGWIASSQIMGTDLEAAVGAESSYVQPVDSDNFADIWNSTTSDHIIIHTHGSPNGLYGEDFAFITENISRLNRNPAIGYVLITACETGGDNGDIANIATLLSQHIAQDGIVVCCTTIVSGGSKEFTATDNGEWIAYCDGEQISCDLPTTIKMEDVAAFWEDFK